MTDIEDPREKYGDMLEWQFVLDYAAFGLRINFEAVWVLYEKALSLTDIVLIKALCLSGMQLMFSSWEDFALLLQAFRKRKDEGLHIYRFLGREEQKEGSSDVPRVFKHYISARKMLDELGFTSINHRFLTRYYLDMSKAEFEANYRELANSVKLIGQYQQENNEIKNRLKHGKGIFEGDVERNHPEWIAYVKWEKENGDWGLRPHWVDASLERLKIAVVHTAKLYQRSMELLWLFMLQYHPDHVQDCLKICTEQAKSCEKKVTALGIKSKGLNK
jgi:hypothetical protein